MKQEEVISKVLNTVTKGKDLFHSISTNKQIEYYCIPLDCSKLDDADKLPHSVIEHFHSHLHARDNDEYKVKQKACLYIFELESHTAKRIADLYVSLIYQEINQQ